MLTTEQIIVFSQNSPVYLLEAKWYNILITGTGTCSISEVSCIKKYKLIYNYRSLTIFMCSFNTSILNILHLRVLCKYSILKDLYINSI